MNIARVAISWSLRHAFALAAIVLILIGIRHLAEPSLRWLDEQAGALRTVPAQQQAYNAAKRDFEAYAQRRSVEASAALAGLARSTEAQLRARRAEIARDIRLVQERRRSGSQLAIAAARGDANAVYGHHRAGAEMALLEQEGRRIEAILRARTAQRTRLQLEDQRSAAIRQLQTSHHAWLKARRTADRLEERPLSGPRNAFCRNSPLNIGCQNYRALVAAREEMSAAVRRNREARVQLAAIAQAEKALITGGEAVESADALLNAQGAALSRELARLDELARGNLLIAAWGKIKEVLPAAVLILVTAIVSPLLIKTVLFFVVAPLGARRPPLVLLEGDEGRVSMVAGSGVSQSVLLEPAEMLLVLPGAVQSTPHHASKRTRWLLSWAMPLSSIAAGMVALTEIRLERPDDVLVSATGGPLNKIALVRVERGSALVLRPRALRGLLHPAALPVRITQRWRLGLSAWLTLQFRYLIFHGPCTLAVEGARGVRLEPAGRGRGVNQAATLGFSAGVAYGVSRSETFGAYLMGRQALFNDSFQSNNGVSLYEEMPLEARRGGILRGGLRGLGDAALKLVGL